MNSELKRIIPQLKIIIRPETKVYKNQKIKTLAIILKIDYNFKNYLKNLSSIYIVILFKDWKMHIEQVDRYEKIIDSQFCNILQPFLTQNAKEINETIERIISRETHLNAQFNQLMHTYRLKQNELAAVTEKYR